MNIEHHTIQSNTLIKKLKSRESGLTEKEFLIRLKKYGTNELPREKQISQITIIANQFKSPLIFILLFAGVVSTVLNEYIDAIVIMAAVAINTIIGYIQEYKANQALEKLRELVMHKAFVIRNGNELQVNAQDLTIGDIIVLKAGNKIPADARLIETTDLLINESSLTGESLPIEKTIESLSSGASLADRTNMVYAGTICAKGSGKAIICQIGVDTEIGKIAQLVSATHEEPTPLQLRLASFSRFLGILIGGISIFIALIGVLQGRPLLEMFIMGVSIAVAAIPEGLIVGVTVILALGMQELLKKEALTRKMVAAETLGSTTVICTDKTGTLTEGKMHVVEIITGCKTPSAFNLENINNSKVKQLALKIAAMCNEAIIENPHDNLSKWNIVGAPTEIALLSAATQAGINKTHIIAQEPKIAELPFDSANKYMITIHKQKDGFVLYEKGAAEKLLAKSIFFYDQGKRKKINKLHLLKLNNLYTDLTSRGLRVIGIATKELKSNDVEKKPNWEKIDTGLTFVGFIALKDPLRKEAKDTIKVCIQAGIRPVMITGDHKLTARAIAKEIGLPAKRENILTGDELDKISDKKLEKIIHKISIFARVNPHHKLRIVKALQSRGEVVAMTGDGINDAPALKVADIGIAMGEGTDIAKEASDIILLDSNFKTIVAAIKQGRIIFANIRKVITYLISDSFSEVILIVGSIILNMPLALIPVQILWINIVNDGFPHFSLAFEKAENGVMSEPPISKKEPLISKEMKTIIFTVGIIRDLFIFGIYLYLYNKAYNIDFIRTLIFAILGVDSLIYIFSIRNLREPIWRINLFSNKVLLLAVTVSFLLLISAIYWKPLQLALHTVPLSLTDWGVIFSVGFITIITIEFVKHKYIRKK
ncbi:HAD-IC family P-type ATPase [Patescibacteria group bacterium]|nr:HAD-IC family P-type ATPase [Patescibacteria group bacterium]